MPPIRFVRILVIAGVCAAACAFAAAQQTSAAVPQAPELRAQIGVMQYQWSMTGFLVIAVVNFCIAVACFALWWNARAFPAFRTLGLYLLCLSGVFFIDYFSTKPTSSWEWFAMIPDTAAYTELYADALHISKRRWIIPVRLVYAALFVLGLFGTRVDIEHLGFIVSSAVTLVLLVIGFSQARGLDRGIAVALTFGWIQRLPLFRELRPYVPISFMFHGWRFNWGPLLLPFYAGIVLTLFIRELSADRREKERLAGELEAGRAVQQVLLGAAIPQIPGLRIESVYKPAGEVGGDFYLVLPKENGSAVIAVGDVSGKGLRAAMTVSAVLGALHAILDERPAEILAALNRSLEGRLHGGFVTCCLARIDPGGAVTVANAGHPSPYRKGHEVELPAGLPLGLTAAPEYTETSFVLLPGESLTFVSDGVVEARSAQGDLFGFDRTRAISMQSAEAIAETAQSFGQEDDITVLTLALQPA
ncbi:MAG TPA: PP2C family protein-serine/threonine phosphatase [Acidobacteriaceae bacterium]|nr:PP2C family protein-serine/threonine phosphatase [Acidobacteriaceae bacterium]